MGTTSNTQWRLGTATRLRYHFGSVAHAVAARGQRLLTTGNGGASQSGGHSRSRRCGVAETLAQGRGVAAPSVRLAVAGEWLGDAGGGAWLYRARSGWNRGQGAGAERVAVADPLQRTHSESDLRPLGINRSER